MTKVAVQVEPEGPDDGAYRAFAGGEQATGRTAGEALDALAARMSLLETETVFVVRGLSADRFFSAEQRRRLSDLMEARRAAGSGADVWTEELQAEMEQLVDAEYQGSAERADALARELSR